MGANRKRLMSQLMLESLILSLCGALIGLVIAYGATKAAQMALARSWQAETARIGPRVLIQSPDPMPTATRARFFPGEDQSKLARPLDDALTLVEEL